MKRLLIAAAIAVATASSAHAQVVTIATSGEGSLTHGVASTLAKEISNNSDLRIRVAPMGGSSIAIPQLNNGSLDFTVGLSVMPAFAVKGEGAFDGRPQPKLRAVAALFDLTPAFMVRADSDIRSIKDLKGRRVTSGMPQQKIVEVVSEASLQAAGLTWADVEEVPAPTSNKGIEDLMAGKVDAVMASISSGKSHQAHAAVGIRWLPLEDTPGTQEALTKYSPGTHVTTIQPSDRYPGLTEPLTTLAAPLMFLTHEGAPDEVVTLFVKTLHDKQPQLAEVFKAFRGMKPQEIGTDVQIPYHKAAIAFFKEKGIAHQK